MELTVTRGGIKPDSRILDVGCGVGRMALPLTSYLHTGQYDGFDVVARAIRWCRRNITPRHRNFRFTHISVKNPHYSILGGGASRFAFPYESSDFDCVVAYSLFTHLQFEEICNYLRESYRVLAPGGKFVATFFLLNDVSVAAQRAVAAFQQFPYEQGPVRLASASDAGFAVAIHEPVLLQLLQETGFRDVAVEPGAWYGLQNTTTFQDLVVCRK